ncbi:PLD nuclease N-terminal domain-containing protein [Saccharopolyspora sp. TS4A08]|uniref:PLD nuclease N-terminal domain-containing protein n=1 Tax=Saccharopolyspora ipomoeae TaxID=3042027 RepID=A0ABT6PPH1_9PSEU|nr:PLD nuclease N-terminal domain-containing protein [Saccharopolyspora sp. TS4A08]MDI2029885.1 PLD nuclease N-terminal domain-containing protein [Saccharopolyspora sp. TS4A08]
MDWEQLFNSPEQLLAFGGFGLVGLLLIGWLALFICAVVSIIGSPLSFGMTLVWLVIAFCAPFLGVLAWFLIGRGDAYRRAAC